MQIAEEKALIAQRTSGWFDAFASHTDEKTASINALAKFLESLKKTGEMPHMFDDRAPVLLDIGTGQGNFAALVQGLLQKLNSHGVNYNGIEYDPEFAARAQSVLQNGKVIAGDGFAPPAVIKEKLGLTKNPDILLASHSFVYSPDLAQSTQHVRDFLNPKSIAIFFNPSPTNDFITTTKGFVGGETETVGTKTDALLVQHFAKLKMQTHKIPFRAKMHFPEIPEALWAELREAKPYDDTHNPHAAHKDGMLVREMVEFVLQRPLEALTTEERGQYLDGLKKKFATQNNALHIDNIIEVVLPPNAERSTAHAVDLAAKEANRALREGPAF